MKITNVIQIASLGIATLLAACAQSQVGSGMASSSGPTYAPASTGGANPAAPFTTPSTGPDPRRTSIQGFPASAAQPAGQANSIVPGVAQMGGSNSGT